MKRFLEIVATDLLRCYGRDMRHVTVVFPSKRASTFLLQELAKQSNEPVWAPQCVTISSLFQALTDESEADPITSICQLYSIYMRHVGPAIAEEEGEEALQHETLDRFWSWGEVMLSDMDDIDKHRANAQAIFSLVQQTEELRSLDYITPQQEEALALFLGYTTERGTQLKRRFMRLWEKMYAIYREFNDLQAERHERYQGALYRSVCDSLKDDGADTLSHKWTDICFVGFSRLNTVEHDLFKAFKQELGSKARFYWDYDVFYTHDEHIEAGQLMRPNLKDFPMPFTQEEEALYFDNLRKLQEVNVLACSTDNAQARYARQWVEAEGQQVKGEGDAIVLCNERLIIPTLHALPHSVNDKPFQTNVTMGFPLTETPVFSFVQALIALQTDGFDVSRKQFYHTYQQIIRQHPYSVYFREEEWLYYASDSTHSLLRYLQTIVQRLALQLNVDMLQDEDDSLKDNAMDLHELYIEATYRIHHTLEDFIGLVDADEQPFAITLITLKRLMRQVFASISIPFHGNQDEGMQVMGVLESRCLDFERLLLIALEEDNLPKGVRDITLIPPHIRQAFELTTADHKIQIYSYYFYRLIQRTKELTCIYNDNNVGTQKHEMSRFLRQLQAETDIPIHYSRLVSLPSYGTIQPQVTPRTPEVQKRLIERFTKRPLSPSSINRYMECPLKFYYQDVAYIRKERDAEDGIDAPLMGTIFHETAEAIYNDLIQRNGNNLITKEALEPLLKEKDGESLNRYLDIVMRANYFNTIPDEERADWIRRHVEDADYQPQNTYLGEDIIIRDVLLIYLRNLLQFDLRRTPFAIETMEKEFKLTLPIELEEEHQIIQVCTGGRVDRIDLERDGVLNIIDYKTGKAHDAKDAPMFEDVFAMGSKHVGYYLQTLLYALAVHEADEQKRTIKASLLYPQKANNKDYNPCLHIAVKEGKSKNIQPLSDLRPTLVQFKEQLIGVIGRIFNEPNFEPINDDNICKNCDCCLLCGK